MLKKIHFEPTFNIGTFITLVTIISSLVGVWHKMDLALHEQNLVIQQQSGMIKALTDRADKFEQRMFEMMERIGMEEQKRRTQAKANS